MYIIALQFSKTPGQVANITQDCCNCWGVFSAEDECTFGGLVSFFSGRMVYVGRKEEITMFILIN